LHTAHTNCEEVIQVPMDHNGVLQNCMYVPPST